MELTENGFLDNRLTLLQPAKGYRAGSDAVLLAAAVPARSGETVFDAGCGVCAVGLCLARRVPGLQVKGLEIQAKLVDLAARNAKANGLEDCISVEEGDLGHLPEGLVDRSFDHVITNPPYYRADHDRPSPDKARALARMEGDITLEQWVGHCLARVRPGGTLTLIHRMERLGDILLGLGEAGEITLFPLWPRDGQPARQLIVQVIKGKEPAIHLTTGLVMHEPDGAFTQSADDVLRGRSALALGPDAE